MQNLDKKYKCLRRIRGDGNCFYRGFGFAYFESLLKNKEEHERCFVFSTYTSSGFIRQLKLPRYMCGGVRVVNYFSVIVFADSEKL